jgi:hypothetical protein
MEEEAGAGTSVKNWFNLDLPTGEYTILLATNSLDRLDSPTSDPATLNSV